MEKNKLCVMCGAVSWVKVKPHNRFKACIFFTLNIIYIKSNGWFFKKISFVLCVGQLVEFTRCVLTWVGQTVMPHNRFIAFNFKKIKGCFLEKISLVLYVGQLAEFPRCVLTWVNQNVKPHNRFKAFINVKHCFTKEALCYIGRLQIRSS